MGADAPSVVLYPIGTVAALCGVDVATLRNWELRYGALHPLRDNNGRRLYSETDVDRIRRIITLLDDGTPIDRAAAMLGGYRIRADVERGDGRWEDLRQRMRAAVAAFDDAALESVYREALAVYPMHCVARHAIVPLLRDIGECWRSQDGAVAEQHFFTMFVRNKIGARFHHRTQKTQGPVLVAACLPGEQHELGLLLFALKAGERGYRICVLGPDTPLSETAHTAKRTAARALVLSSTIDPGPVVGDQLFPPFIANLEIPVFIGGSLSPEQRKHFAALGVVILDHDHGQALDRIGAALAERD